MLLLNIKALAVPGDRCLQRDITLCVFFDRSLLPSVNLSKTASDPVAGDPSFGPATPTLGISGSRQFVHQPTNLTQAGIFECLLQSKI